MQDNILLSVNKMNISFGGVQQFVAVNDISFKIAPGKTLAIVGESGSGKSLTALALLGLLPKGALLSGDIHLQDSKPQNLLLPPDDKQWQQIRGNRISMVFQEPMSSLNPVMKIGKQLTETIATHSSIDKKEAEQIAIEWLGKVKLPNPGKIYRRYPHQLSGGQKQRVMIAMAMCNNPQLLVADEPTTALDVTVQKEVIQLMHQLQQEQGSAMIFITHDLALAAEIADDVMVMYKGEVMDYGTADKIFNHPEHPYTKALIACRPNPNLKNTRLPVVADFLVRQAGAIIAPETYPSIVSDETLLQVTDLKVWFTENQTWLGKPLSYFKAVDGVSFELKKGEILGLVGESGCGKSTISRSLIGLQPVNEGQILFKGEDLAQLPLKEWGRVRREIQMIFQDPFASLNPRMTVGDMLKEPMRVHNIVPKNELDAEAKRLLDIVQLPAEALKRYPHQFSGGQRQRLVIARALALRPELLICDESVSALDISIQAQILNLLKDLQQEFQLSYLFISHDLSVVQYISDRVMVMQAGKIVEEGTAEQVLNHPANDYTKRLIAAMPKIA